MPWWVWFDCAVQEGRCRRGTHSWLVGRASGVGTHALGHAHVTKRVVSDVVEHVQEVGEVRGQVQQGKNPRRFTIPHNARVGRVVTEVDDPSLQRIVLHYGLNGDRRLC